MNVTTNISVVKPSTVIGYFVLDADGLPAHK
jgi:hypothetical protein